MKKLLCYAAMLLFACNHRTETNENLIAQHNDTVSNVSDKAPHQLIGEILKSIPSPLETSNLIRHEGGIYSKTILLPTDSSSSNYHSSFKKALVLGIYGTDLGYVNIYEQNQDVLSYLNAIQSIADELRIGQYFDYHTFRRLAANSHNMDSLLYLTVSNFEKINEFLNIQKRSDHSLLIITGGWLEALHICCEVSKNNKSPLLKEKIGEQKIVLDQLLVLFSHHQSDENMVHLTNQLLELKKAYAAIDFKKLPHTASQKVVDGVYFVEGETETNIQITEDQIHTIERVTEEIRNGIII